MAWCIPCGTDVYRASLSQSLAPRTPVNTPDTSVLYLSNEKKELEESSRRMIVKDTKDLIQSNWLPMPNTIWIITNYPVANVPCMNVFADDFEWAVCHLLVLGRWWPQEDSEPRLWLQEAGDAGPNPTNQMNLSLCQDPASETYSSMIVKNG